MRKIAICVLLLAGVCSSYAVAQNKADDSILVIAHVNVVDVATGSIHPNETVVVDRDRIIQVGKIVAIHSPKNRHLIDGRGKYLIPGLWDMHVHTMFGDWIPGGKQVSLPLFVANGVTGVRDMGGNLDTLLGWRKEITAGTLVGPRLIVAGPMLDGPKPRFPDSVQLSSPEQARQTVDDLKRRGADFIKV